LEKHFALFYHFSSKEHLATDKVQGFSHVVCQRSDTALRAEALRPLHFRLSLVCGFGQASLAQNHTPASVAAPQVQSH